MKINSKYEILNSKQIQMTEMTNPKQYDLEDRCFKFAQRVNHYVNRLPKIVTNIENGKQLVRSSGSMGANYIEANEALSKKDFVMRIKISRKESKETRFWIMLTEPLKEDLQEKDLLIIECTELMKIFGSILEKSK